MITSSDIVSALIVGALYIALFVGVELWSRRHSTDREASRKLVHFGGGMVALGFPWFFSSHWPVLFMALLFTGALLVARRLGFLRSVQGVERITIGELIYPIAIYLTLLLTSIWNFPYIYVIAVLVLAVADALAGLIGKRYGRRLYRVNGERKSLEGSLAFFLSTLAIVFTGLAIAGEHPPLENLPAAVVASLILTALEAVAPRGTDNIAVPLGAWGVLMLVARESWIDVTIEAALLLVAASFFFWLAISRKMLEVGEAIVMTLLVYGGLLMGRG